MSNERVKYDTSNGLNIGTGLMLESLVGQIGVRIDDDRVAPVRLNIDDYKAYYINVEGFAMNVVLSYAPSIVDKLCKGDKTVYQFIKDKVIDELSLLIVLLNDKVTYYFTEHKKLKDNGLLRVVKSESKTSIKRNLVKRMSLDIIKEDEVPITVVDQLVPSKEKCLVTTSNILDMVNRPLAELLEFHTGVHRKNNTFWKKLKVPEAIPFNELLVYLHGDKKGVLSPPTNRAQRKLLMEMVTDLKLKPFRSYGRGFLLSNIKKVDDELYDISTKLPTIN